MLFVAPRNRFKSWYCTLTMAVVAALVNITPAEAQPRKSRPPARLQEPLSLEAASQRVARLPAAALFAVDEGGREVLAVREHAPLIPASTMKLLTAVTALERYSPHVRFYLDVYVSSLGEHPHVGAVPRIYLTPTGTADFTIEEAWLLVRALRARGITEIGEIVLDDARFTDLLPPRGGRAYEAGTAAFSFNYGSRTFVVCPGGGGKAARVTVDPWEVPTPILGAIRTVRRGGTFTVSDIGPKGVRVGGAIGATSSCVEVYRSVPNPSRYFGEVLPRLLENVGIKGAKAVRYGPLSKDATLLYRQPSATMGELVGKMNEWSNNVSAEQLAMLVGCGVQHCSHRDGVAALLKQAKSLGIPPSEVVVADGSGLDRRNRFSARALVGITMYGVTHPAYGREFEASLAVSGMRGTLRRKRYGLPVGTVRAKTGTLNGVDTLAGVILGAGEKRVYFALLLNQLTAKDRPQELEEQVVRSLWHAISPGGSSVRSSRSS